MEWYIFNWCKLSSNIDSFRNEHSLKIIIVKYFYGVGCNLIHGVIFQLLHVGAVVFLFHPKQDSQISKAFKISSRFLNKYSRLLIKFSRVAMVVTSEYHINYIRRAIFSSHVFIFWKAHVINGNK